MSMGKLIKCLAGLAVAIFLSATLPFFDSVPWNIPSYKKRAVVRDCIRQLARQPALTVSQYRELSRDGKSPQADALLASLRNVYPSATTMIYQELTDEARIRAWGLLAVEVCAPRGATQGKYAPPLGQTIKLLQDPDPVVAANALSVLQTFTGLPPDYAMADGPLYQKQPEAPGSWYAAYDTWYRTENPAWHMVECRYYGKRNWPKTIR